jgi:hypothetical protein
MYSGDGGQTWARLAIGLRHPTDLAAVAYAGERVFASDRTGVYEWSAPSKSWQRTSSQVQVVAFAVAPDGVQLYAFSPSDGVRLLRNGTWRTLAAPGQGHARQQGSGGHVHLELGGIAALGDRLYVAGTGDGVTASSDGGRTWTQLAGGISDAGPNQLTAFRDQLWVATPSGLYRLQLGDDPAPTTPWWAALISAALGLGLAAAVLGALARPSAAARRATAGLRDRLPGRRRRVSG